MGQGASLQRLLTHSTAAKVLAVRRVTENNGKANPRCGPRNLGHTREEDTGSTCTEA